MGACKDGRRGKRTWHERVRVFQGGREKKEWSRVEENEIRGALCVNLFMKWERDVWVACERWMEQVVGHLVGFCWV